MKSRRFALNVHALSVSTILCSGLLVVSTVSQAQEATATPVAEDDATSENEGIIVEILHSTNDPVTGELVQVERSGADELGPAGKNSLSGPTLLATTAETSVDVAARYLNADQNGVDPVDGSFNMSFEEGSIGSGEGRISLIRTYGRSGWTYNVPDHLDKTTTSAGKTYVTFALSGVQVRFDLTSAGYVPENKDGSTLTESADHKLIVYTDRNGSRWEFGIWFDSTAQAKYCGPSSATNCMLFPVSERRPNGLLTYFTWQIAQMRGSQAGTYSTWFERIDAISNNAGYRADFQYVHNFYDGQFPTAQQQLDFNKPAATIFSSANGVGQTTTREFGSDASTLLKVILPTGQSYDFTYRGKIGGISKPISTVKVPGEEVIGTTISYNTNGVNSVTRHGVSTTYARTVSDLVSNTVVSGAYAATYQSDTTKGRVTKITNVAGDTVFSVSPEGRIQSVTYPGLNSVHYEYDGRGNIKRTINRAKPGSSLADIVTMAAYPDGCTNLASCNKPIWTRDAKQSALYGTSQDSPAYQTDYGYFLDGQIGFVTSAPDASGARPSVRFSYQQIHNVNLLQGIYRCRTDPWCSENEDEGTEFFGYNNQLEMTIHGRKDGYNGPPIQIGYQYNVSGQVTATFTPAFGTYGISYKLHKTIEYDAQGRLIGVIDGYGDLSSDSLEKYSYDSFGRLSRVDLGYLQGSRDNIYDPVIDASQIINYDGYGRRRSNQTVVQNTPRGSTEYYYDAMGRLGCTAFRMVGTSPGCDQASADARLTRYGFDALNRINEVETGYGTSDARIERRTFTPNGQLATVTDGKGNQSSYSYDDHGRLYRSYFPSPGSVGSVNSADYEQLSYDANGNVLTRRLRDGQSIGYQYDGLGRLTLKDLPGSASDVGYAYDLHGNLVSARFPASGETVTMSYDAIDRIRGVQQGNYSYTYEYNRDSQLSRIRHQDGLAIDYTYDSTLRLQAIRENGATSGPGVLATFAYNRYDELTAITRGNGTATTYQPDFGRLARLTHDLAGTTGDLDRQFTHNAANQITRAVSSNNTYSWAGTDTLTRSYTVNGLNQYLTAGQASFTYDLRGNLTSSGNAQTGYDTYGYDAENRMTTMNGKQLTYDPLGRLRSVTGSPQFVMQPDGALLAELAANNTILRRYVFAPGFDRPIVQYEGVGTSNRRWLHADERGSIIASTDAAGQLLASANYDEFGNPGGSSVGRFGYTGQLALPEIGLYYYKARMYSPSLGRFMQTDPIEYGDGLNVYNYVRGDPVNSIDPSGLTCTRYGTPDTEDARENYRRCKEREEQDKNEIIVPGTRPGGTGATSSPNSPAGSSGGKGAGGSSRQGQADSQPKTELACGVFDDGSIGCKRQTHEELCAGATKRRKALTGIGAADLAIVGGSGLLKQIADGIVARLIAAEIAADVVDELMYCK